MLPTTSGRATRQYNEGGFPSKMNCSNAVTSKAETITNPCKTTLNESHLSKIYTNQKI